MKNIFVRLTLSVSALLAAGLLCAQSGAVRVNIPFDFIAGGLKLSAGEYSVEETGLSGTLILHGLSNKQTAIVTSAPGSIRSGAPSLTFERHGASVYLSSVYVGGDTSRLLPLRK